GRPTGRERPRRAPTGPQEAPRRLPGGSGAGAPPDGERWGGRRANVGSASRSRWARPSLASDVAPPGGHGRRRRDGRRVRRPKRTGRGDPRRRLAAGAPRGGPARGDVRPPRPRPAGDVSGAEAGALTGAYAPAGRRPAGSPNGATARRSPGSDARGMRGRARAARERKAPLLSILVNSGTTC